LTAGGDAALPLQIDVEQLRAWMQGDNPPALLDVRESWETDICRIAGSQTIPMGQIPQRLKEIPDDRPLVVICHHGGRSMQVTMFLRSQGYEQAVNLSGGVDRWARQIDPKMPTY